RGRARQVAASPRLRITALVARADEPAALIAAGHAESLRAHLVLRTHDAAARVHATAEPTHEAMRAPDVLAARRWTAAAHARRRHAESGLRIARQLRRTRELRLGRAVRHAMTVLAGLIGPRAGPAHGDQPVAIVVETIADLGPGREELRAPEHAVAAFGHPVAAGAGAAGIAGRAAARAFHALDAGDEVGELVVGAAEDVFPGEVELPLRDAAVVDEQVNVRRRPRVVGVPGRLRKIRIALPCPDARRRRATIAAGALPGLRVRLGRRQEEPDVAAGVRGIIDDVEHDRAARLRTAADHDVQVVWSRRLARHVVPAEHVVK